MYQIPALTLLDVLAALSEVAGLPAAIAREDGARETPDAFLSCDSEAGGAGDGVPTRVDAWLDGADAVGDCRNRSAECGHNGRERIPQDPC